MPQTVLYEPLLRGAETIGVLVVGWPGDVKADGPRIRVVELLAHEAAAVLTRADALSALSDQASTDPLTGLPNRRAWDARVADALSEGAPFTVAMLDFDHFKQYNDTYGHPAGDRLLKETAAMWREQVRSGDLLARLGGEEFGLLLLNCQPERVREVIERLRGAVYHDRTCSVGFAVHRPGESSEQVTARADAALYEAKESGRDRVCMSAA
jgi:diguanylate cyclase (GGDEF)-like protein